MQRKTLRSVVRFLFKNLSHLEVIGLENLPSDEGYLLAVNHLGRLDAPLVFSLIERERLSALVADKYQSSPFFRWIVNQVNGIWINRDEADIRALKAARDYLKAGGVLGIAPEGTRSQTGELQEAKTGVAFLADRANVPVIPVGISGTQKALSELLHLRRPEIRIVFGEPLKLQPIDRRKRAADLQRNSDEIMCRIAALLPSEYRGVYQNHPRLQELLAGQAASVSAAEQQTEAISFSLE
jgi:1-acyl-sn-glycerol-3-phosphate acyltransferase